MFDQPSKILGNTRGSLTDTPLPLLLNAILLTRRTGGLEIKRQGMEKMIIFDQGCPVGCTTNLVNETLGRYLVEKGVIDEQQHLKLMSVSARAGVRFEDLLLRQRTLDSAALAKHLQANLAHRILDCFRWPDAKYRLVGDIDIPDGPRMNAVQLIYTGTSTTLPIEQLKAHFAYGGEQRFARCHLPPHGLDELKLGTKDARLFEALSSRPRLAELPDRTGFGADDALRRIYALSILGFVDKSEKVSAKAPLAASAPTAPASGATTKLRASDDAAEQIERLVRQRKRRTAAFLATLCVAAIAVGGFFWSL